MTWTSVEAVTENTAGGLMAAGGDDTAAAVWETARAALAGLPGGGLNMAVEAVERHVVEGNGGVEALRWHGKDGAGESFTYEELLARLRDVAGGLGHLGYGPGVRVFTLLGRVPELYLTVLGTLYAGEVAAPLFSAFGPGTVRISERSAWVDHVFGAQAIGKRSSKRIAN
ncbi:MAG: AMP-binding protein [Alphaproteobacteria bacterium]